MQDMRQYIIEEYSTPAAWNGSDQARKQRVKQSLPTATVDAGTHITAAPEHEPDPYERVLVRSKTGKLAQSSNKNRINIHDKRDVVWMAESIATRGARIYVTEPGDYFLKVCDKLGIAKHLRKLYDAWLGIHYGPGAPAPVRGGLHCTYLSPWEGERRRHPLSSGSKFPAPQGPSWVQFVQEHERLSRNASKHGELNEIEHGDYDKRERNAFNTTAAYLGSGSPKEKHHARVLAHTVHSGYVRAVRLQQKEKAVYQPNFILQASPIIDQQDLRDLEITAEGLKEQEELHRARAVTIDAWRRKMDSLGLKYTERDIKKYSDKQGRYQPVFSMKMAEHCPDFPEWVKASRKEWEAIEGRHTFGPYQKLSDIRAQGIMQSVVPSRELLECKGEDGEVQKWKTRVIIQGSPNNCKKGEHYYDTYAPAPNMTTTRMLLTLIVQLGLMLYSIDVCSAYLWGRMKPDEIMPIRMPEHQRKYDKETGEELYRLLLGSCYGCPQSSKVWSELRDTWLVKTFNGNGWTCTRTRRDPCLFIFTHLKSAVTKCARAGRYVAQILRGNATQPRTTTEHTKKKECTYGLNRTDVHYTFLVVHTDDVDIVGQSTADMDFIITKLHDRFKITRSDSSIMLGLKRELIPDGLSIQITQQAYIEGICNDFANDIKGKKDSTTPFPPGLYLSKQEPDEIDVAEVRMVLKQKRYMNLVGALLWSARCIFVECAVGCHFLTRLLATPTMEAFNAGIHMLLYLRGKKAEGLIFKKVEFPALVTYYDASNRGDTTDKMKAIGGHIVFLCNGPVSWSSKKLNHVGQSSAHNEYQALANASKATMWLRYMMAEMHLASWVKLPTMMMGDNDAATTLCRNDLVTPQNCYYSPQLYFSKECFETHCIDPTRIDTKLNYADGMTKAIPRQIVVAHVPAIRGLVTQQNLPSRPRR